MSPHSLRNSRAQLRLNTLFLGLALLLSPLAVRAQEGTTGSQGGASAAPDELFFDSVEVNVVNVEVFVTDRNGNPISDLTRDDFELYADGDSVEISNFLAVDGAARTEAVTADEAALEKFEIPQDQRLHVVVFIDNLNLAANERNRVLEHLRRFLRTSIDNQDRVLLASFDGNLKIHQEFTSIPELLYEPLDDLAKSTGRAREIALERRLILNTIEEVTLDLDGRSNYTSFVLADQLKGQIQVFGQRVIKRNRDSMNAMARLIDSLAGLPGRKAMLYISGGMPMNPTQSLFAAWRNKFAVIADDLGVSTTAETLSYDSTPDLAKLVAHANANRVVLYTIDAGGPRGYSSISAETGGFDVGSLSTAGGGRVQNVGTDSLESATIRSTMQFMSDSTGGLSFLNTEGLGNTLSHLASDFESFYSLGYTPATQGDGEYRRLEVKVLRDNVRVRHRAGYVDKSAEDKMSDRTMSALLLNVFDNPLGIELERAESQPDEDDTFLVPVLVKVPISNVALLPTEDSYQGRISLFIAVRDLEGGTSPVSHVVVPIKIPLDKMDIARGQFAGYTFKLRMREGFQRIAVGVRDEVAAVDSTVRMSVRVGG